MKCVVTANLNTMISLILPEHQFPTSPTKEAMNELFQKSQDAIIQAHAEFVDRKLREALIALHGEMPSDEDVTKHCKCVIDRDSVAHYIWYWDLANGPKVGEHIDLSKAFCVIAPPKIFTPNNENQ